MNQAHRINKPYGLNHGLSYLPWLQLLDGLTPFERQSITPECLQGNQTPVDTIRLLPGMTLRLRQSMIFQRLKNTFVPPQSTIDWKIPSGLLSSEDFLFLSTVLSCAEPDPAPAKATDYVAGFQRWTRQVANSDPDDFLAKASQEVLKHLGQSCAMTWHREGELRQPAGTAARVREWLTQLSSADANAAREERSHLTIRLPILEPPAASEARVVTFRAYHSPAGLHLHPLEPIANLHLKNEWVHSTGEIPCRTLLEARIPFRFSTAPTLYYAPVWWSWADVESHFGIRVGGVRRTKSLIRCAASQGFEPPDTERFDDGTGRAHIAFDGLPGVGEKFVQLAGNQGMTDAMWRQQLLVAPGDVFILHPGL